MIIITGLFIDEIPVTLVASIHLFCCQIKATCL